MARQASGPALRRVAPEEIAREPPLDGARLLEQGAILLFPPGLLPLPAEEDLEFLRGELAARMTLKNVSYHPRGDYLSGLEGAVRERATAILRAHGRAAAAFLGRILPRYAALWEAGKVNFRPLEEHGRELSRHSSNELLHVDAFASGATHGARTLRFFTNVHPTEPRVWRSAGLFPELFREFGRSAGIVPLPGRGLAEGPLDRLRTGLVRFLARRGLPQALTIDSSPYDRAMKRLHDALKDDDAFQRDLERFVTFEFPPFSSWAVLTDMVSHACVRGRHALVSTWSVPLAALASPELAPFRILAAGSGSSAA
jgi:hypothetical protein